MTQETTAFALYDGFSTLEFAALFEPLTTASESSWDTCARSTDVYDAQGLHFYPTRITPSLAGYEIVIIPGSPGVTQMAERSSLLEWIATARSARLLVATGSGVLLLAAAGLAQGRRVSACAEIAPALKKLGAVPVDEPWVVDGPLATARTVAAELELAGMLNTDPHPSVPSPKTGNPSVFEEGMTNHGNPIPWARPPSSKSRSLRFWRRAGDEDLPPISGGSGQPEPAPSRLATVTRETHETQVEVRLDLDGSGAHEIDTGLPFLDHMLAQVAVHGLFDLYVHARGDLQIDPHHTLEDVALTLGSAFQQALGDRAGIARMASADCPMDESLAWVAVDFSGRPYCVFQAEWHAPVIGGLPASLFAHFLESFALNARCNLHAAVRYGRDDHHQAEAVFKALGRALCQAARIDPRRAGRVPSSKGVLF